MRHGNSLFMSESGPLHLLQTCKDMAGAAFDALNVQAEALQQDLSTTTRNLVVVVVVGTISILVGFCGIIFLGLAAALALTAKLPMQQALMLIGSLFVLLCLIGITVPIHIVRNNTVRFAKSRQIYQLLITEFRNGPDSDKPDAQ